MLDSPIAANSSVVVKYIVTVDDPVVQTSAETKSTVTYSVNEITDLEEDSNIITISLGVDMLTITKTSNKTAVIKGQTLKYQHVIENKGNYKHTDIMFNDNLPEDVEFIVGSVMIDNVSQAGLNPTVGFKIDDIDVGGKVTITFDVTIK